MNRWNPVTAGVCALAAFVSLIVVSLSGHAEDVLPHHLVGHEESELLLRIQDVIDDWDPRKLENPLVETSISNAPDGKPVVRKQLRRSDLAEFIADVDAAEALGKAFFWEMQAGSDFTVTGEGESSVARGTACASCHYRHGADARNKHTRRIPYVAWDQYVRHPDHPLEFGQVPQTFPVETQASDPFQINPYRPAGPFHLIVGSQGVEPRVFKGFNDKGDWQQEVSEKRSLVGFEYRPDWSMFISGDIKTKDGVIVEDNGQRWRQITNRNSPSVINSGFSDRLFHDGRAESTFNGFSIFGDFDKRDVIHRVRLTPVRDANGQITNDPPLPEIVPVHIAITNAALASQAVGPIVNEIEMSYLGRQFPNVAHKLLTAKVLGFQTVDSTDSVLGRYPVGRDQKQPSPQPRTDGLTYEQLIQRAFRSEWWDDSDVRIKGRTPLILLRDCEADGKPEGSLMEGNFSLYWGLSIMLYEASLVSNQSPFDEMMRGRSEMVEAKWSAVKSQIGTPIRRDQVVATPPRPAHESGSAVFQHGFRVFMNQSCIDCHGGPFFSELYERSPEAEKLPIDYTIERTLLPNSRSDALAANLRTAHQQMLKDVATLVATIPEAASRANKIAIELDELRHVSYGRLDVMDARVTTFLQSYFSAHGPAADIAKRLFRYEKSLVSRMGNRTFFSEDERIAMAEALGGPVLVEKMGIPLNQLSTRPRLPIAGPLATEGYAFYDASFYNLGVSLPRYDRGNGEKHELDLPPEVARLFAALREKMTSIAAMPRTPQAMVEIQEAQSAIETFDATGDAKAAYSQLKLNDAEQKQVDDAMDKEASSSRGRSRFSSSPGSAYRFRQSWNTERYQSEGYTPPQVDQPEGLQAPAAIRTSSLGSTCDYDQDSRMASVDTSWSRADIPFGANDDDVPGPARRDSYYFLSRARRLVSDERHWGFRKPFLHDNELAFWGTFKTPTLRNVELTAPYMHNGRLMTLMDVVEFYDDEDQERQLIRDLTANPDKHPEIGDMNLTDDNKRALVFFLMCLTDDRVRYEQAPFDHPSIEIVNGYEPPGVGVPVEDSIAIDAVGQSGHVGVFSASFPSDH